tara:strand:+ start:443 stop:940 length:498 start_codon:yes stop_codon:yes gene_type:complete
MARLATSWNEIKAGDIISFKYKSERTGKSREHTILVLNPKFITVVNQQRTFHLIGLKLAEQSIRTIKEGAKVVTQIFNKLGTIVPIDETKDIYRVDLKKSDLFWGGAKESVYKRIKYLLGKEPIYRTYVWEVAKKSGVYYQSIPIPESTKRQFFGNKNTEGKREV